MEPKITEEVCAVILMKENGDSLLQLRDDIMGITDPNTWVFPGGHPEPGEDITVAAYREMEEETGYVCRNLELVGSENRDARDGENIKAVHAFMEYYDGMQETHCFEGQKMEFRSRDEAEGLAMPTYLIQLWDVAIERMNTKKK